MSEKRPYRMSARAQAQAETRQRIVEAAMHLHEQIGPRATTISAIAERAGVQRLTVYRHFPDETAVFQACSSLWLNLNPLPDPADWSRIAAPEARAEAALNAFYRYYSGTRRMWTAAYRDVAETPALQEPMAEVAAYLDSVADGLAAAYDPKPPRGAPLDATLRHALAFSTWAELEGQGLSDADKTALALGWISGAREDSGGETAG